MRLGGKGRRELVGVVSLNKNISSGWCFSGNKLISGQLSSSLSEVSQKRYFWENGISQVCDTLLHIPLQLPVCFGACLFLAKIHLFLSRAALQALLLPLGIID